MFFSNRYQIKLNLYANIFYGIAGVAILIINIWIMITTNPYYLGILTDTILAIAGITLAIWHWRYHRYQKVKQLTNYLASTTFATAGIASAILNDNDTRTVYTSILIYLFAAIFNILTLPDLYKTDER